MPSLFIFGQRTLVFIAQDAAWASETAWPFRTIESFLASGGDHSSYHPGRSLVTVSTSYQLHQLLRLNNNIKAGYKQRGYKFRDRIYVDQNKTRNQRTNNYNICIF